jgi:ERCC4-type nuclease
MANATGEPSQEMPESQPRVVADLREPDDLLDALRAQGVNVDVQVLAPADFVVGNLAIERKSVGDFHASLIDKRLFEQAARMKSTYESCALLLEGDLAFFAERKHPRAIWGAMASLSIGFGLAVLPVPDKGASAQMLGVLARRALREGRGTGGAPEVRFRPRMPSVAAQQKFAVQGFPGVGDVVSEALLEHFGSVRRVYEASERDLLRVAGIGKQRAWEISAFLDRPFEGRQRRL